MAVKSREKLQQADEAEVSNCVSNLIQAFTNGLNVFRRLRDRRRKRKTRKEIQPVETATSDEIQLSKSLRRGPQELAEKYDAFYSQTGQSFAKGDAVAHASLAETLVKLNTGLVAIIASFLNHDQKDAKGHLKLNYKSLTNLSDASRREALQSMTQLYQRLSQSQLHLHQMKALSCARCGSSKHHDCSLKNHSATTSTSEKNRNRHTSSRQRVLGPTIARMPLKSSSHPQLVVIRPKTTRKGSSGSASSSKSPSSSNHASPLASPLPLYIAEEMVEIETAGVIRGVLGGPGPELLAGHGRRRKESFNDIRPSTWPDPYPYHVADPEVFYQHMAPAPKLPTFSPTPRRVSTPQRPTRAPPPPPVSAPPIKRRMDKLTPSSYTFASDSTKLGEIPQRNWTTPWDYEEAERLNNKAAVAATAYAGIHPATVDEKTAKKKGMFRWMRRGSAGA